MSVAVLKLEDETLVAFNLNMVSRMDMNKDEFYFIHEGVLYTTSDNKGSSRRLRLHPSTLEEGNIYSPKAMFDKFCNL